MTRHWRIYGRAALALLLVASLALVFAHWHRDSRGQECGLCNVQQMPTLQAPTGNLLPAPTNLEWNQDSVSNIPVYFGFVIPQQGRAPPKALLSV